MNNQNNQLRIRNGAVKELHFTEEQIKKVNAIKIHMWTRRHELIKETLGGVSVCCICRALPKFQVIYDVSDKDFSMKKKESYCALHMRSVYEKTKNEPTSGPALAELYGLIKVDALPHTPREEYIKTRKVSK